MNDIKNIIESAKRAVELIENGKTYPTEYVVGRFVSAAEASPGDHLISHMRDVLEKVSGDKDYFTQVEIEKLYNKMYGLSGGRSTFKNVLGDFLPDKTSEDNSVDYSQNRVDVTADLNGFDDGGLGELAAELSSVFSLDVDKTPGFYSNDVGKRAEGMVSNHLSSIGCRPDSVSSVRSNEHYMLCIASYNTADFTNVNIKVPVQISDNRVRIPTKMIEDDSLVDITKENIHIHLKDSSNRIKREASSRFSEQRRISEFRESAVVVPSSLEEYADLENDLVSAVSKFNSDDINRARNVVAMELAAIGVSNVQINISSSNDKLVNFSVKLPTVSGGVEIEVPIEIHGGRPTMPIRFSVVDNGEVSVRKFNKAEVYSLIHPAGTEGGFVRDVGPLANMSYHELVGNIIDGVSSGEYRTAEDALSEIGTRFGSDHYMKALDKFSSLLKASSSVGVENNLVREAFKRGDLIEVPTSIEPYCPKLGMPLRKLSFDDKGRLIPKNSNYKIENLRDSGAHISTSKIVLT